MAAAVLAVTFLPGGAAGAGTAAVPAFQTLPLETIAGRSAGAAAGEAVLPEHTTEVEAWVRRTGTVPIRLDWAAQDTNGLSAVRLLRPTAVDLGTTGHSRNGTLRPGFPATFIVQATDRAGNATSASVTRTPVVVSEAASQRTGTWRTLRNPRYLGGVALGSTAAGASASWTFTGRSVALVVGRGAASGRVRIFVDGADAGLVDLRSTATTYGQAVWSRSWGAGGSRTVRVEVEGAAGRPGVVLDGLAYLT